MKEHRRYKPGDTFRWDDQYEAIAHLDRDNDSGCDDCIGILHTDICDALPRGCNEDEIVWKPNNEAANVLVVILKLEGKTVND